MTTYWDCGIESKVSRKNNEAVVVMRNGYNKHGDVSVQLKNTGNGYIAHFPSHNSTTQDYYVCLDYSQAYDLILALAEFKKEMGFK